MSCNIAFTICSNNYLAQAKVLGDSVKKFSPDYDFYIGLVDTPDPSINYQEEIGHRIVFVDKIDIPEFDSLWKKYDIIEFNTCVKPFYFEYFISKNGKLDHIFYFDPDTCLFAPIINIENEFKDGANILLTPHIYSPIALDEKQPDEPVFLNYGIYNLGFLGLRVSKDSKLLLNWWKERTFHKGFSSPAEGLFVDQLWFNLVPLFFENVHITSNRGINMGPWNLHERVLSEVNGKYLVNNQDMLILYHFSNYKFHCSEILASYYDRFNFSNRNDLSELYQDYLNELCSVDIEKISNLSCYYMDARQNYLNDIMMLEQQKQIELKKKSRNFSWFYKATLRNFLPPIISKLIAKVK